MIIVVSGTTKRDDDDDSEAGGRWFYGVTRVRYIIYGRAGNYARTWVRALIRV